jgi:hypothetical protein
MSEGDERSTGISKDDPAAGVEGQGGEGARNAEATPEIGTEDQEHGQTTTPAPDDAEAGGDHRREE